MRTVIIYQVVAVLSWFILSLLVGFGGVFLTGLIPVVGLGLFLACLGSITHAILIAKNIQTKWWRVGGAFAILLGTLSIGPGMASGDRYPLWFVLGIISFYFVFSALFYVFIEQVVLRLILDDQ